MSVARVAIVLLLALARSASAHKPSDSFLSLQVQGKRIAIQWDIAIRDLEWITDVDDDGDGQITWGELRHHHKEIADYALARLKVRADGEECPLGVLGHQVDRHSDGAYTVMSIEALCGREPKSVQLAYDLFFAEDAQHRGLARIEAPGKGIQTAVLTKAEPVKRIVLAEPGALDQFVDFLKSGIKHIWIGYDHILFLVTLLLPAVLVRDGGRWVAPDRFAPAFWNVLKVVTAFTVAHSVTLALAALGLVHLPSRLVESAIAASILVTAANNVWPFVEKRPWLIAFVFGLVHGFGFASVLADLGLARGNLAAALVGFNAGVEVGQLVIVALVFPALFSLRATGLYRRVVLAGGSVAAGLMASLWLVERAADVKFLPF